MSYTFLLEQGEESSAECFSGMSRCAPSSWRNTLGLSSSSASEMGSCPGSPCGMMFGLSMGDPGEGGLMSYVEGSPARTSARPAEAPESTGSVPDSGLSLLGSLARWDRSSSSWRTPQSSFLEGLDEFSETWPRWGSMRNGVCWGRLTPERPMSENESGFLVGTPTATMLQAGPRSPEFRKGRTPTPVELAMWPTPKASTAGSDFAKMDRSATGISLVTAVAMFPTPTATNTKANHMRGADKGHPRESRSYGTTGQLNPEWVEWLMGWPRGWTDLGLLSPQTFREWQQVSSTESAA